MSGMRGTIAKRMQSSLQDMAQLTLHMDADLDAIARHWHRQQRFEPKMDEATRGRLYAGWLDAVQRVRSGG